MRATYQYDCAVRAIRSLGGLVVLSLVLLGCGSGGQNSDSTKQVSTPRPLLRGTGVPPPKARESIARAVDRIGATGFSGNCAAINRVTALSRPYNICQGLQDLVKQPITARASYGDAAGVIAYGSGEALRNAILIVDSDGLYHLPLVDPIDTAQSIGTPFATQFDAAARDTVDAMRARDCDRFRQVALARFGSGAVPGQVCAFLDSSALTAFLASNPDAKPVRLGGNQDYAFYAVSGPEANFTMVMARESDADVAAGTPPLPKGAPEYGFVDAYQTNPAVKPAG